MNSSKGYYEEKYLKYKYKYLQLKKIKQIGGSVPEKRTYASRENEETKYEKDKSAKKFNIDNGSISEINGISEIDGISDDSFDSNMVTNNTNNTKSTLSLFTPDLKPSRVTSIESENGKFGSNTPITTIDGNRSPFIIGQRLISAFNSASTLGSIASISHRINFFSKTLSDKTIITNFIKECDLFLSQLKTPYQPVYPLTFFYGNTPDMLKSISKTCSVSHTPLTNNFEHVPIAALPPGFEVSNKLLLKNNSNEKLESYISSRVGYNIRVSIKFDNEEQIKDGTITSNFLASNTNFKDLLQLAKNGKKNNMYHWYPIADVLIKGLGNISVIKDGQTQSIYSHLNTKDNIFICDGANIASITEHSSPFLSHTNLHRAKNLCAWLNLADQIPNCATIVLANKEIGDELEKILSITSTLITNLATIHQTSGNNLIILINTHDHPTPNWIKPATSGDQLKINSIINLILFLISQSSDASKFNTKIGSKYSNIRYWMTLDKITEMSAGSTSSRSTTWSFQTDINGLLFTHQGYKQKGFDDGAFSLLAYMFAGLFKGARILTNDRCKTEKKSLVLFTLFSLILEEIKISSFTDTSALSSNLYDEIFNTQSLSTRISTRTNIASSLKTTESVLLEIFKEMDNQKISSSHQGVIGNMLSSDNSIDNILAGAIQIIGQFGSKYNGIFDYIEKMCTKYNIDVTSLFRSPKIISNSSYNIRDKKILLEDLLNKKDTTHNITGLSVTKLFLNHPFTTFDATILNLGLSEIVDMYDTMFGILVPRINKLHLLNLKIKDLQIDPNNIMQDGKTVTKTKSCRDFVPNMKTRIKGKLYGDSKCSVCNYALMYHYNEDTFTKYKEVSLSASSFTSSASSFTSSISDLSPSYKNIKVTRFPYIQDEDIYTIDDQKFTLIRLKVTIKEDEIVPSGLISLLLSIINIDITILQQVIPITMKKILNNKNIKSLFTLCYKDLYPEKVLNININNHIDKRIQNLNLDFFIIDCFWLIIFKRLKIIEQDILIFSPSSLSTSSTTLLKLVQIGTNNNSPKECICVIKNENNFSPFLYEYNADGYNTDMYTTIKSRFQGFNNNSNFDSETDLSNYLKGFKEEFDYFCNQYWDTRKETKMDASESFKSGGSAPK